MKKYRLEFILLDENEEPIASITSQFEVANDDAAKDLLFSIHTDFEELD